MFFRSIVLVASGFYLAPALAGESHEKAHPADLHHHVHARCVLGLGQGSCAGRRRVQPSGAGPVADRLRSWSPSQRTALPWLGLPPAAPRRLPAGRDPAAGMPAGESASLATAGDRATCRSVPRPSVLLVDGCALRPVVQAGLQLHELPFARWPVRRRALLRGPVRPGPASPGSQVRIGEAVGAQRVRRRPYPLTFCKKGIICKSPGPERAFKNG